MSILTLSRIGISNYITYLERLTLELNVIHMISVTLLITGWMHVRYRLDLDVDFNIFDYNYNYNYYNYNYDYDNTITITITITLTLLPSHSPQIGYHAAHLNAFHLSAYIRLVKRFISHRLHTLAHGEILCLYKGGGQPSFPIFFNVKKNWAKGAWPNASP